MAKIWSDIEIEWGGEAYTVRPSIELINHLERKDGRSLSRLFQRVIAKDLPSGAACELIADTLSFAGAKVTAEDVFIETAGGANGIAVELAATILIACMPAPKETAAAAPGKKKTPKKSTGAKSTA